MYGYGPFDKTSKGVWGRANAGRGVMGEATTGVGVYAVAGTGGTALYVAGPAGFSRSGLVGVPQGASSFTKTGIALKSGSLILAVVNQDVAGVFVHRVVPNVAGGLVHDPPEQERSRDDKGRVLRYRVDVASGVSARSGSEPVNTDQATRIPSSRMTRSRRPSTWSGSRPSDVRTTSGTSAMTVISP